jgi:single-strand DNA-binding protein
MNNLNSVLLEGRLVDDVKAHATEKGVCVFSISSSRYFKNKGKLEEEVSFFDVEAHGVLADTCMSKGHKGRGARIVGRMRQDRWEDSDGVFHSRVVVVAEHVEFRFAKEEG